MSSVRAAWVAFRLPLVALCLLGLLFLGPSGCGCGDSLPSFVRNLGVECCTRVWWYVPEDSDYAGEAVQVRITNVAPLGTGTTILDQEIVQSPEMDSIHPGDVVWFEVRLRMQGALRARLQLEIDDAATNAFRAAAALLWLGTCEAVVDRGLIPAELNLAPEEAVVAANGDTSEGGEFQCVVCNGPEPCCCTFQWVPPPELAGTTVDVVMSPAGTFGLTPLVYPRTLTVDAQGLVPTFRVCLPVGHEVPGSLGLTFVDADLGDVVYGGANLIYEERCLPTIAPIGDTVLYSLDCGQSQPCCCQLEWCPTTEVQPDVATTVDVVVVGAAAGLEPEVAPSTLVVNGPGDLQTFAVCVRGNHPLGATAEIELREHATGALLGGTSLVYRQRCIPTVVAYSGTTIYSPDCGTPPPRCCCTIRFTDYSGEGPKDLYAVITGADPSLEATVGDVVVPTPVAPSTAMVIGQPYEFEVCVEQCHPFDAELTVHLYEVGTQTEVGWVTLRYPTPCVPTIYDASPIWAWSVLCE